MARIGFIGLGIMGSPMAVNLVKAGHQVTGFSRRRSAADPLVEAGGTAAGTLAEAVADAEVVVTMLPDSPDVEQVFRDVLAAGPPARLFVDFSTIRPETSRAVAEAGGAAGMGVLDAPVSGGQAGAVAGTLSIMCGGTEADFSAATPLFEAVGKTYALVGPHGAGQVVKAANQLVVGGTYALVAEAIVLMERSGVDAGAGLDMLAGGLAASRILELKRATMLAREFTPGFRIDLHHKDMGIAIAAARAEGHGALDHSALLKVVEALNGPA